MRLRNSIRSSIPRTQTNEVRDLERRIKNLEKMVNSHTSVINSIAMSYPEAVRSIGNLAEVQAQLSQTVVELGINVKKLDTQANTNLINLFKD